MLLQAFSAYAQYSKIVSLTGQVRHLRFFRYFFDNDAFVYALLALAFVSFLVLGLCDVPKDAGEGKAKGKAKAKGPGSGSGSSDRARRQGGAGTGGGRGGGGRRTGAAAVPASV